MAVASSSHFAVNVGEPCRRVANRCESILLLVAVLAFLSVIRSFAQTGEVHVLPRTPPDNPRSESAVVTGRNDSKPLKVNVSLVLVPVTVTDPIGRFVTGLERENFAIYENKQRQEIRHLSSEDAPVSIGLIFDVSGSMNTKIERAREAVIEFLKAANPKDEFFMIAFSDQPHVISDFTESIENIQSRLLFIAPKGRTALLDAIYLGVSKLREAKHQRKALLIISDGGDNHSRYSEREIESVVKEADALVYAIGIYDHYFSTEEEKLGPRLLSEISEVTGGRAFVIDNPNDLADVATKIGIELRNQYVLGYYPTNRPRDGKWHKIKVKLIPPKGLPPLQVSAKQGYYAPHD